MSECDIDKNCPKWNGKKCTFRGPLCFFETQKGKRFEYDAAVDALVKDLEAFFQEVGQGDPVLCAALDRVRAAREKAHE